MPAINDSYSLDVADVILTVGPPSSDIWISSADIAALDNSGAVWDAMEAQGRSSYPAYVGQDTNGGDPVETADTSMLAAAYVAMREGDVTLQAKVGPELDAAITLITSGASQDSSLGASRDITSLVIAADVISHYTATFLNGVKTLVDPTFENWGGGQDGNSTGRGSLFWKIWKVNNHGAMALAAYAACNRYLQRIEPSIQQWTDNLDHVFQCLRFYMGEDPTILPSTLGYDKETDWNFGPDSENWLNLGTITDPYVIYPLGATDGSNSIDGLLPEEARRGSSTYVYPPPNVTYYWEFMQGLTVCLKIMDRAGYTVYPLGDFAHQRAAQFLYGLGYTITGDDLFQGPLLDEAYGMAINGSLLWDGTSVDNGKNMGWTGWSIGVEYYAGPFSAQPADAGGFLVNDTDITNASAQYVIWDTDFAQGDITWFGGGSFQIDAAAPSGSFQFRYRILDLDGQGTDSELRTVSVTVT